MASEETVVMSIGKTKLLKLIQSAIMDIYPKKSGSTIFAFGSRWVSKTYPARNGFKDCVMTYGFTLSVYFCSYPIGKSLYEPTEGDDVDHKDYFRGETVSRSK